MANRHSTRTKLSVILIAAFLSVTGWLSFSNGPQKNSPDFSDNLLYVHFIDVGQADSILIEQGKASMLIDAGNNEDKDKVQKYLNKENITSLDYLVGTHPHEDHIGGLDGVIKTFDISTILMPKAQTNTKTFEDVLTAIKNKNLTVTTPIVGKTYKLGDAAFTILSPAQNQYDDLNEYSIVIRLVYKNRSFLFMGDADNLNEKEIMNSGLDLKSDVIKIGHHGSESSSKKKFINSVSPEYAVITVSKDNDYNHPSKEVVSLLNEKNIKLLRTDKNGTIVFTTDGNDLSVSSEKP